MKDKKLDDAIVQVAYIADCLMAYRNINETGRDCNQCAAARACEYAPKPGEQVRYNCPHYVEPKEVACDSITCTNEEKAHDTTTSGSEIPNITQAYVINTGKKEIIAQVCNGDMISRQAALDALNCNIRITGRNNAEKVAEMLKLFTTRIKGLPAEGPTVTNDHAFDADKIEPFTRDHENDKDIIFRNEMLDAFWKLDIELQLSQIDKIVDAIKGVRPAKIEITEEAAIEYLNKTGWMPEHDRIMTEYAQPKSRPGKWLSKDTRNNLYECSECGLITYSESVQNLKEFERFCSRCGARLEVDADDT